MVTVEEYSGQLQQLRQQLEQSGTSIAAQKRQPFTQQQLRGTKRIQRQQAIQSFEKLKGEAQARVQTALREQEQREAEFEPQLEAYEQAKASQAHSEQQAAEWELAEKLIRSQRTDQAMGNAGLKYKIEQLEEAGLTSAEAQVSAAIKARDLRQTEIQTIQAQLPEGETLQFDPGSFNITGVQSEQFGGTFTPEKYNIEIEQLQQTSLPVELQQVKVPKIPTPDLSNWEKIKGLFEVTPKGIGISVPGAITAMAQTPSPQEVVASKLTPIQFQKVPVLKQIADIEYTRLKTVPDKGSAQFFFENLGTAISGAAEDIIIKPIETVVTKLPYETRVSISEAPGKAVSFLGKEIKKSPIVKYPYELMKVTPAPQEWGFVQRAVTKGIPIPIFGGGSLRVLPIGDLPPIKVGKYEIGFSIKDIEEQYQKEVTPKIITAPEGQVYITEGKEVTTLTIPGREPGRYKFFMEKLGKGYEETFTGLSETYFRAKQGIWVDPWAQVRKEKLRIVPWIGYEPTKEAKFVGKVAGVVAQAQPYVIGPVLGIPAAVAPFAEAAGRGELKSYAKKNPWEVAFTAGYIGLTAIVPIIKYAKEPIVTKKGWFVKPKETLRLKTEVIPIKKGGKTVWQARYALKQTFNKGIYYRYSQPRFTTWLKDMGLKTVETAPTKAQIFSMAPAKIKAIGGTLKFTTVTPRARMIVAPLFDIKTGKYVAREFVGRRKIPNLYSVEPTKSIGVYGYRGKIRLSPTKAV